MYNKYKIYLLKSIYIPTFVIPLPFLHPTVDGNHSSYTRTTKLLSLPTFPRLRSSPHTQGMLDFTGSSNHNHGFPRMRGEYPSLSVTCRLTLGSPPHTRGVSFLLSTSSRPLRITPACAENTFKDFKNVIGARDHPRLRGEYYKGQYYEDGITGSPPLARGIPIAGCI